MCRHINEGWKTVCDYRLKPTPYSEVLKVVPRNAIRSNLVIQYTRFHVYAFALLLVKFFKGKTIMARLSKHSNT